MLRKFKIKTAPAVIGEMLFNMRTIDKLGNVHGQVLAGKTEVRPLTAFHKFRGGL